MIKWNKKTYARELKKGYWNLEPHFHYYSMFGFFELYKTFIKEKMNLGDIKSALYGEFVCEGKPIKKGFYEHLNFISGCIKDIYYNKIEMKKGGKN